MHIDDLVVISIITITATLVVHRRLTEHPWFLAFLAIAAPVQVALAIMFPEAHFASYEVMLLAVADAFCMIALVFLVQKLLLRGTSPEPIVSTPSGFPRGCPVGAFDHDRSKIVNHDWRRAA